MGRPKKFDPSQGQPPLTKQECVLQAAQEIFLEQGYAAASMDAVAARANVSKATIYAHFDNKRALFEAVISQRCVATFSDFTVPAQYADARHALMDLAIHFLERMLTPEALAIHRVVLGESPRLPEVGEAFYEAGPALAMELVGRLFSDLMRRGLLSLSEAEVPIVVDLFLAMLKGDLHMRALFGLPCLSCSVKEVATAAVDLVMARYGVGEPDRPPITADGPSFPRELA